MISLLVASSSHFLDAVLSSVSPRVIMEGVSRFYYVFVFFCSLPRFPLGFFLLPLPHFVVWSLSYLGLCPNVW